MREEEQRKRSKGRAEKERERMMSVSSIFGCGVVTAPHTVRSRTIGIERRSGCGMGMGMGMVIECSSKPQKKATAHHMKTRPRKTQPWDINRKPTVYPPLPPLPPDWTLVIPADASTVPPPPTPSP